MHYPDYKLRIVDNVVYFSFFAELTALLPEVLSDIIAKHWDHNGYYTCTLCKRKIRFKHDIQRHLQTHTGIKNYQCIICRRQFSRRDALIRHAKKCRAFSEPNVSNYR